MAYPELALKKITGLDVNEKAKDFSYIVEKKVLSVGTRPAVAGANQDAYETDNELYSVEN